MHTQTGTEQAAVFEQQYLNGYSAGNCSAAASLGDEWGAALNAPHLNTLRLVRMSCMHALSALPSSPSCTDQCSCDPACATQ
jgi:hypothetical protein